MSALTPEGLDLQAALAGEYSLERELGRGGMGIVYLARDVQLDRHVAIKVLPAALATRESFRERFLREARTAAGLSHPNIVPIHRVGEAAGFVFFVMSYVPGQTLGERLRTSGPLAPAEAMRVMREVAWALAYAHGRGIVHRDIKPDNILLEEGTGRALVTDFGIAYGGTGAVVTDPGKIMGTAHFMSPEQAANGALDGRSDIYSLGVVGYLAVSGRLPFEARSVPALLVRQTSEAAPSVAAAAPGLPSALSAVIDRCLQRDPAQRVASGEALAEALAPESAQRLALPAPLRSWLSVVNPAQSAYTAWAGLFTISLVLDVVTSLKLHSAPRTRSLVIELSLALAPLIPLVGFHVNQARRLFRGGFTLGDLRAAIALGDRERAEGAPAVEEAVSWSDRALRIGTYLSFATALSTMFFVRLGGHPGPLRMTAIMLPWISSLVLAAAANVNDVPMLPRSVRGLFTTSIRDRLWKSRVGEWFAKRLHAPTVSRPVGGGIFRATEILLGDAAADLFAALPEVYRRQLADLPHTVASLESRAAEAREEAEKLSELAAHAPGSDSTLIARRDAAKSQLATTVAALEGIRLDLLRLHAGASDLAPLTTLLDAARQMAVEIDELADAQREVGERLGLRAPALERREATPV